MGAGGRAASMVLLLLATGGTLFEDRAMRGRSLVVAKDPQDGIPPQSTKSKSISCGGGRGLRLRGGGITITRGLRPSKKRFRNARKVLKAEKGDGGGGGPCRQGELYEDVARALEMHEGKRGTIKALCLRGDVRRKGAGELAVSACSGRARGFKRCPLCGGSILHAHKGSSL